MKKCPCCGAECSEQDIFCCECGASLRDAAVQGNSDRNMVTPEWNVASVESNMEATQKKTAGTSKKSIVIAAVAAVAVIAVLIVGGTILLGDKGENDKNQSKPTISDGLSEDETPSASDSEEIAKITPAEVTKMPTIEEEASGNDTQKSSESERKIAETAVPTETPVPDSGSESAMIETVCTVINCNENITLRSQPSVTGSEICKIPLGAEVSFVSIAGNGFYQIAYNGNTGYALGSYLSINPYDTENPTYMEVVNCSESITLRRTPSTKADEFCQIPLGATVQYLDTAENGFYMISYDGYIGYALASYLKL